MKLCSFFSLHVISLSPHPSWFRGPLWLPSLLHTPVPTCPASSISEGCVEMGATRIPGPPLPPSTVPSTLYRWKEKRFNSPETYFCDPFFAQHSLSRCVFFSREKNHPCHFQWPYDIQANPTPHTFTQRPLHAGPVVGTGNPQGPVVCVLSSGTHRSTLTFTDSEHHGM